MSAPGEFTSPTDLAADYTKAGFLGRLEPGSRPAVLVVDLVMAYLSPSSPLYAAGENVVAANGVLVSTAHANGVPVLFTQVVYQSGGADGGLFYRKVPALAVFGAGSTLGAFPPDCHPTNDDIIVTKQYASAFFGTSLASTLTTLHVDTVLIGGFSTSGCVRATAVDALSYGFVPVVVREAVGDRDSGPHEASLFDLQAKYAEVTGLGDAVAYLATGGASRGVEPTAS